MNTNCDQSYFWEVVKATGLNDNGSSVLSVTLSIPLTVFPPLSALCDQSALYTCQWHAVYSPHTPAPPVITMGWGYTTGAVAAADGIKATVFRLLNNSPRVPWHKRKVPLLARTHGVTYRRSWGTFSPEPYFEILPEAAQIRNFCGRSLCHVVDTLATGCQ